MISISISTLSFRHQPLLASQSTSLQDPPSGNEAPFKTRVLMDRILIHCTSGAARATRGYSLACKHRDSNNTSNVQRVQITFKPNDVASCPTDFVLHERLWDNFTHRLCDKKRDSANLLIRLFFRPSSIADAAISIFVLISRRVRRQREGERERKREIYIYIQEKGDRNHQSIDLIVS